MENKQMTHNLFLLMWKRELKSPLRACTPVSWVHPFGIWSWESWEARAVLLLYVATLAWVYLSPGCTRRPGDNTKHSSACSDAGLRDAGSGTLGILWRIIIWLHLILIFSVILFSGEICMFSARILSCCFYSQNSSRDFSEYPWGWHFGN